MSSAAVAGRAGRTTTGLAGALLVLAALVDAVAAELRWPVLVFLTVAVLAVADLPSPDRRHARTATAVAVCASLLGTLVLALAGPSWIGFVEGAALGLLLLARWRRAADRTDWLLAGGVVAALVVLPLRTGGAWVSWVPPVVAAVAVVVAVAAVLRGQDAAQAVAVALVRRAEREEIARELHDVVAHHVTGIVVATQGARTVAAADPAAAAAALEPIEAAGSEAMASMRRLVGVLRTDPSSAPRLPASSLGDLPDLVQRFRAASPAVPAELRVGGSAAARWDELPTDVQAALYRVVQESLTNVRRHAPGSEGVSVDVEVSPEAVTVQVADGGDRSGARQPLPAPGGGGFGVVGMRERVAVLGGALTAGPRPGLGWVVRAVVPLTAPPPGPRRGRGDR